MINPRRMATIQDVIEEGKKLEVSHANLHMKFKYDGKNGPIIINYISILDKYYDVLIKHTKVVQLSDDEYFKYRFQPKLLSLDLYGTTELWSSILKLNNITSASQFTLTKLKVFNENIFEVINEILILEKNSIERNKREIYG